MNKKGPLACGPFPVSLPSGTYFACAKHRWSRGSRSNYNDLDARKSMPFVYNQDSQSAFHVTLSRDRLNPYVATSNGDFVAAMLLYEFNTKASEALYGVLQALEVAYRNACYSVLANGMGQANWYDTIGLLDAKEAVALGEAKVKIGRRNKYLTPGRVVAELTFGFWVRLLSPGYEKRLWVPHLYKAFSGMYKKDRQVAFGRMENIRKLRNRVAHHETIFDRNLNLDYAEILEAINWICPVTAAWIRSTNSFAIRGYL